MTLGWSKSFMHAASLRNSSISLWEKLSTGKQRERKSFETPKRCQDAVPERVTGNAGIQWDKLWGKETTYTSWSSQPPSVGTLRAG